MIHRRILIFFAAVSLYPANCMSEEYNKQVQRQERSLTVEYKNGSKLENAVVFTGYINVVHYEDGEASTLTHPIDTRKCHWTVTPTITRQTFVVLPDGERAEKSDLKSVYNVPFQNQGSDFVLTQLRPENCGDAQSRYNSDVQNGINAVNRDMSAVIDRGYKELIEEIQKKQGVAKVASN